MQDDGSFRGPANAIKAEQLRAAESKGVPVEMTNRIGMKFILVPPGTFRMGSPAAEQRRWPDEVEHPVTITHPYYMQSTEVTVGQFRLFRAEHEGPMDAAWGGVTGDHPVTGVTFYDALAFVAWLNRIDPGLCCRLPTEAEWERACRAGTATPYSFGETICRQQANYDEGVLDERASGGARTMPVGSYAPNALGLFDMHGNVSEWCMDVYGPVSSLPCLDPMGAATGQHRVLRGGDWASPGTELRSAVRQRYAPGTVLPFVGFRVAAWSAPLQAGSGDRRGGASRREGSDRPQSGGQPR